MCVCVCRRCAARCRALLSAWIGASVGGCRDEEWPAAAGGNVGCCACPLDECGDELLGVGAHPSFV